MGNEKLVSYYGKLVNKAYLERELVIKKAMLSGKVGVSKMIQEYKVNEIERLLKELNT